MGGSCDTNFMKADSAELAKEGKLAEFVQKAFGGKLKSSSDGNDGPLSGNVGRKRADWIIDAVEHESLEYIDKRDSGGNLWVVGDKSIKGFMHTLEKRGAKFTYKEDGDKASKGRPAWFIPASAAARALKS